MTHHKRTLSKVIKTCKDNNRKSTTQLKAFNCVCLLCLMVIAIFRRVDPFKHTTNPDICINLTKIGRNMDADLRIIVITFNRYKSLRRLLHSLNKAYYENDKIILEIWLDRSPTGEVDRQTFNEASYFQFNKGIKYVNIHTKHVGIYGQWMGTWQPNFQTKEIAVIFEDDTTVSPWFYRYLKKVHVMYSEHDDINGFSLQVNIKHGSESGQLNVSTRNIVFLYPVIGTSGFSPKRNNWIRFLEWYKQKSRDSFVPLVPEIRKPTEWYTEFIFHDRTDTMWEMWHICYAYYNNELTLYPNFGYNLALTINWKEMGLHFDGKNKGESNVEIVKHWDARFDSLPRHPIYINTNGIEELLNKDYMTK